MNGAKERILKIVPLKLIITAFVLRLGGIFATVLGYNTYAKGDAKGFARYAKAIAQNPINPEFPIMYANPLSSIYVRWGSLLSPFWFLPGPSLMYARIAMAILGVISIYNVYLMGRSLHSQRAGVFATLPMVLYPSFIVLQSTVLREAAVLFGITTATRILLVPPDLPRKVRGGIVVLLLTSAAILRPENTVIFLSVVLLGLLLTYGPMFRSQAVRLLGSGSLLGAAFVAYPYVESKLNRIASIRLIRARGRTEYLPTIASDTIPEAVAFSWIGIGYFLYTPFPWMITQVADFVIAIEAIGNLLLTAFAIQGVRKYLTWESPRVIALVFGFLLTVFLYGLGTANVGTAVRHRPMFVWVIYLFGGIGLAQYVRVHL